MKYIRLSNGEYPVTREQIAQEVYPMILPGSLEADHLSTLGFGSVQEVEPPHEDGYQAVELAPLLQGNQWVQQWELVPVEPEVPEVPYSITRAQGKAILIIDGIWDDVLIAVDAIADPTQKALAEIAMNEQVTWLRDSPTLLMLAAALGLTEEQIDGLFIRASKVTF